jgi:RNA polymerase sigma factor (sigma-70 family)
MIQFQDLYQKYAADVYRFAFWLCGNQNEAEDITSETFIRAWGNLDRSRTETVKAYLFMIARNLYLKQRKENGRFTQLDVSQIGHTPDPAAIVADRIQLQQITNMLRTLPEIDRSAFIMRVKYEMPYAEIARVLNISLSATKVKVHRARLKLAILREEKETT